MTLLTVLDLSLPLKNPVLQFSLILFIILFAPIILNRFKIPHLIGLIIAGALIGPAGFNLMLRNSSIVLFGTVGLLYIMFLAGLEINMVDFKKNSFKSLLFGLYTFIIPMVLGTAAGYYVLQFPIETSVLLASMFASHTLVTYPLVGRFGVTKNRAVNITVGGTMITDTLALLVLAVITGMATGDIGQDFWIRLAISVVIFGLVVTIGFPIVTRWFFKKYDDNISQYIFVLGMVFLGGFLAEAAGIESIIGAFLAGLALNRLIPHTSPLMNRIEFVGNALFIPFFLIGVGMLIDFGVFFEDFDTILIAFTMIVVATGAKYIAAWLTQKSLGFTKDERSLIFGLSNAQAAATLAVVLIGYEIRITTDTGEEVRLLGDSVLNGTILMILVTCTIASFVTQKAARNISLLENTEEPEEELEKPTDKILIPLSNPETVDELVNLAAVIKSPKALNSLYALNVISTGSDQATQEKLANKILEKAEKAASATDNSIFPIVKQDVNLVNGITNVVREQGITDVILGLHRQSGLSGSFLGNVTEGILKKSNATTFIFRPAQPVNTVKRQIVVVPPNAEQEPGFLLWLLRMWRLAENTKVKIVFYATQATLSQIKEVHARHAIEAIFNEFTDWEDFLIISRDMRPDDGLIIILSRKDMPSYDHAMTKIPKYLNAYFKETNFILIYPIQNIDTGNGGVDYIHPLMTEPIEKLDDVGKVIAKIFKRS